MEYKEFVDNICEDVQNAFFNMTNKNVTIAAELVDKLGGDSYYGIKAIPDFQNCGVCLDLHNDFEAYKNGIKYNAIVYDITSKIEEALAASPVPETEALKSYSNIADSIMLRLVPTKKNEDRLKGFPHRDYGDISVTYSILFNKTDKGDYTVTISNDLMDEFGVTEEKLWNDALKSAPASFPASIRNLMDVVAELTGSSADSHDGNSNDIFVATCNSGVNGAGCIFYPGLLKGHAERVGGDLFILPSSVHEVLLIADDGELSYTGLEEMVKSVNDSIDERDYLSDTVYHYDSMLDRIETAGEFFNK